MILSDREPWMDEARCAGLQDLFFPNPYERVEEKEDREAAAGEVCRDCPVLAQCREHARKNREWGFWGGENDEDRTKAINNQRRGPRRYRARNVA